MKKIAAVLIGSIAWASMVIPASAAVPHLFATPSRLPDGGTTIVLLSSALVGLGLLRRKFKR